MYMITAFSVCLVCSDVRRGCQSPGTGAVDDSVLGTEPGFFVRTASAPDF